MRERIETVGKGTEFDGSTVGETFLRLRGAIAAKDKESAGCPEGFRRAMEQLITQILALRSPHRGWPETLDFTPENLLPYVSDEGYDVWDHLKVGETLPAWPAAPESHWLIEDLSLQLLWQIATSSYTLMQLTGGIVARQGETEGILRLVPILHVQADQINWAIDLATLSPPVLVPPTEFQLPSQETAVASVSLLAAWERYLYATTPHLQGWTQPLEVEILEPGKDWSVGTVSLKWGLEWIGEQADPAPQNQVGVTIRFTDPLLISAYRQSVVAEMIAPAWERLQDLQYLPSEDLLPIIEEAIAIVDRLHLSSAEFLNSPFQLQLSSGDCLELTASISLNQWIPYLLWELTSISEEMMQLLGQVPACVLQPEWGWDTGTLRLVVLLHVKAINQDLQIDLATGQTYHPSHFCLMNDAMIEFQPYGNEPKSTQKTHQFLAQIQDQMAIARPTLGVLLAGTSVQLSTPSQPWKPGLLQLTLAIEFIPQ